MDCNCHCSTAAGRARGDVDFYFASGLRDLPMEAVKHLNMFTAFKRCIGPELRSFFKETLLYYSMRKTIEGGDNHLSRLPLIPDSDDDEASSPSSNQRPALPDPVIVIEDDNDDNQEKMYSPFRLDNLASPVAVPPSPAGSIFIDEEEGEDGNSHIAPHTCDATCEHDEYLEPSEEDDDELEFVGEQQPAKKRRRRQRRSSAKSRSSPVLPSSFDNEVQKQKRIEVLLQADGAVKVERELSRPPSPSIPAIIPQLNAAAAQPSPFASFSDSRQLPLSQPMLNIAPSNPFGPEHQ